MLFVAGSALVAEKRRAMNASRSLKTLCIWHQGLKNMVAGIFLP
jgi:hypothetical protein